MEGDFIMGNFGDADIEFSNRHSREKIITTKYNCYCRDCRHKIKRGEKVIWNPKAVGVLCLRCGNRLENK
jgi:predicted SprT family Zn-dependent metalloprotease